MATAKKQEIRNVGTVIAHVREKGGRVIIEYDLPTNPMVKLTFGLDREFKTTKEAIVEFAKDLKANNMTGVIKVKFDRMEAKV